MNEKSADLDMASVSTSAGVLGFSHIVSTALGTVDQCYEQQGMENGLKFIDRTIEPFR